MSASDYDYQHSVDDYEMTQNDDIYNDISFDYRGRKFFQLSLAST